MDRTAATSHADHDELLIVRLFGGDVDEVERSRALDLMADCEACATLFADLGSIADATAALPVPARPRDFSLSTEDAARLRRRRFGRQWIFGAGSRRSLGGSLAAIGLVGVVATGAVSLMSGSAMSSMTTSSEHNVNLAAAPAASSAYGGAEAATAAPLASRAPAGVDLQSSAGGVAAPSQSDLATPAGAVQPVSAPTVAAASPDRQFAAQSPGTTPGAIAAGGDQGSIVGADAGTQAATPSDESAGQATMDARLIWIGGFAALFVVGLLVVFLPRRPRRHGRGSRS